MRTASFSRERLKIPLACCGHENALQQGHRTVNLSFEARQRNEDQHAHTENDAVAIEFPDREFQIQTEVHQTRERRAVDDIADRRSDAGPDESKQAERI